MKPQEIKGQIVDLLPFNKKMVSNSFVTWLNDPEVNQFLEVRHSKVTRKKQREIVRNCIQSSDIWYWAIATKTGDVIGSIKVKSDNYGVGEVGIFIGDANYWNRGIATETIRIICQWAESQENLRKLSAGCYSINQGSIQAFIKNGFQIEGNREEHIRHDSLGIFGVVLLGKILSNPKILKSVEKSI